jgi:hypothetical protein
MVNVPAADYARDQILGVPHKALHRLVAGPEAVLLGEVLPDPLGSEA